MSHPCEPTNEPLSPRRDCPKIAHEECGANCLMAEGHDGPCVPAHAYGCPGRPSPPREQDDVDIRCTDCGRPYHEPFTCVEWERRTGLSADESDALLALHDAIEATHGRLAAAEQRAEEAERQRDAVTNPKCECGHRWREHELEGIDCDEPCKLCKCDAFEGPSAAAWIADLTRQLAEKTAEVESLRGALTNVVETVANSHRGCVGDHYIRSPQISEDTLDRWRAALAAKERS